MKHNTEIKGPVHLLIVENDEGTAELVKNLIARNNPGFTFSTANDRQSAISTMVNKNPDCVLLDYILPGVNGLEIINEMKSDRIDIPVIILTGYGDEKIAADSIKAGAYDYLSKDILAEADAPDRLLESISTSLNMHRANKEKKRALRSLEMSEARYKSLIENSPILILRFLNDRDNMISSVNNGFCDYFQTTHHNILGEKLFDLVSQGKRDVLREQIESLSRTRPTSTFEYFHEIDGTVKWQIWTIQAIFGPEGKILEYQCMGEDISGLKKIQTELGDTLNRVKELKEIQDGDYFLTSLLLEPLNYNRAKLDNVTIEFIIKEKKEFEFRHWKKEIGGDICLSNNIMLKGKLYGVFINADAMGKSIQGAGGALVLGAVFQSIINRTRFSSIEQDLPPEHWLMNTHNELQKVFESFDGSMLASAVIGLIDDESGLLYYINAEHPFVVLYRDGSAKFIDRELQLWKLGVYQPGMLPRINTCPLQPGDMVFIGSDGKDDIIVKNEESISSINENMDLFLNIVEKSGGDIAAILESIQAHGTVTDDISIMKIYSHHRGNNHKTPEIIETVKNAAMLESSGDLEKSISTLVEAHEKYPHSHYILRKLLKTLINNRHYDESLGYCEKYCYHCPSDTEMIYATSFCFKKTGNMEKAIEYAERVHLREPDSVTWMIHLSKLYIEKKDYIQADSLLDRILSVDRDNRTAISLKNSL